MENTAPVPAPQSARVVPEGLNECLERYDAMVYVGSNNQFRLAGDVNRIQDIVDGPCKSLLTRQLWDDFTAFFDEVDLKIAEYIRESGGSVVYDPKFGIDPRGTDPDLVEECFLRAYHYYRVIRPPL